jgi:hypothetical protein
MPIDPIKHSSYLASELLTSMQVASFFVSRLWMVFDLSSSPSTSKIEMHNKYVRHKVNLLSPFKKIYTEKFE